MPQGLIRYHGAPCRGTKCCGILFLGGLRLAVRCGMVAWLGACFGHLAWVGMVGAADGLHLGLLVDGLYAFIRAHENTDAAIPFSYSLIDLVFLVNN